MLCFHKWQVRVQSLELQVSLVPHEPGRRVVFDDKDWRHKSLGQLVRGHRFPGIRKTLSFTIITTFGVPLHPICLHTFWTRMRNFLRRRFA